MKVLVYGLLSIALYALSGIASALDAIPEKDGFSGYINMGAAGVKVESNMIAGNSFGDISQRTITSLYSSPESESESLMQLNGEVAYTWASSRTQVYFGNLLEDFIEFDFSTLLGVRHELTDKSIIAASYMFSSIPTEVWEDPYLINQRRSKTDRDSKGVRLEWDKIAGTGLDVQYSYRNITLDDENSGRALGLSIGDMDLLDREGSIHDLKVGYTFNFGNGHSLEPKINYTNRDLDGRAMKNTTWGVGLTHIYNSEKYSFVTNLDWAEADFDKRNPIYNKTRNDDRLGIGFTAAYKRPFGLKHWHILGTLAYYDSDSNIKFYDTNIKYYSISALYRF